MNGFIIFCVGALAAAVSEVFWKGSTSWRAALWGGMGMLLLRRIVLRFPFESRALLSICGALLLLVLSLTLRLLQGISTGAWNNSTVFLIPDPPSFAYGLYRFLLIAPAYAVIEYLESCFRM